MNYVISALALLMLILLFIRSVLPKSAPPMTIEEELNPRALAFKLTVLSMNSALYKKRGGGLNVRALSRPIKRFIRYCRKLLEEGGRPQDFERRIFDEREVLLSALREVERASFKFYSLPHCGIYPRLYDFCSMMIKYNGGFIDYDFLAAAVRLFNEHSPLLIDEICALRPMLTYCLLEQIAVLCCKSTLMRSIASRARKDADKERIDLTCLKYNTYVHEYYSRCDCDRARKFAAVCMENDVDVHGRCDAFQNKCSRYSALSCGALSCLEETVVPLTFSAVLPLYINYEQFMNAEKLGFRPLTDEKKKVYMSAFSVKCRREKQDEIKEGKETAASGESAARAFLPRSFSVGGAAAIFGGALAAGCAPSVLIWIFGAARTAAAAVFLLPVFASVSLLFAGYLVKAVFSSLYLPAAEPKEPVSENTASEFSFELTPAGGSYAHGAAASQEENTAREQDHSSTRQPSLSDGINAFERLKTDTQRLLGHITPVCSLTLILLAPLVSAWLLAAAYGLEIALALNALRTAVKRRESLWAAVRSPLYASVFLPCRTMYSLTGLFKRGKLPSLAAASAQAAAAAGLILCAVFIRPNAAFFSLAAVYAAAPVLPALRNNFIKMRTVGKDGRKVVVPSVEKKQIRYEEYGLMPRVGFLTGGGYVSRMDERGEGCDSFNGETIMRNMKLYVERGGKRIRLKLVLPMVIVPGRVIINAVGAGRTFTVESTALGDGGKTLVVKQHGGGEFTLWCAHETEGREQPSRERMDYGGAYDGIVMNCSDRRGRPLFCVCAAKDCGFSAVTDEAEFITGTADGRGGLIAARVKSREGRAELIFTADFDQVKLMQKTACAFKSGYIRRSYVRAAAQSEFGILTPALSELASHIIYSDRGIVSSDLCAYIDPRFFTVLLYIKSPSSLSRLYGKLKGLYRLKRLGLCFNVVVAAFENPAYFAKLEGKVNLMFDEFAFGVSGRACCLNCEGKEKIYLTLKEGCVAEESVRFKKFVYNAPVKSCPRAALPPPTFNEAVRCGKAAVTKTGERVSDGLGEAALSENLIGSQSGMGFVSCGDGRGFTFFTDPFGGKLTPKTGLSDELPSEFLTFSEAGRCWSASVRPLGAEKASLCRHGHGFTEYYSSAGGFNIRQTLFLSSKKPAKLYRVEIVNGLNRPRKLSAALCVIPALGYDGALTRHVLTTARTADGLCAKNNLSGKTLYFSTDRRQFTHSLHLEAITDERGDIARITGLRDEGRTPALIISVDLKLPPLGKEIIWFSLSPVAEYDFSDATADFQAAMSEAGTRRLSFVGLGEKNDLFFNNLGRQAIAALLCGCSYFEKERGEHFASQLIKAAAAATNNPALLKQALLAACSKRFYGGDILLIKRGDRGERAYAHPASLFLPMAVARYIDLTDERDVLFDRVAYLSTGSAAAQVAGGGVICRVSHRKASVLEHCVQSIDNCLGQAGCDCLGIDARLLLLRAIKVFMPYVKDGETRRAFAARKAELENELKACRLDGLSDVNLAWLAICGLLGSTEAVKTLTRRVGERGGSLSSRLWLTAGLLACGESQAAYRTFTALNPLCRGKAFVSLTEGDIDRPSSSYEPALACLIAVEGFFGCRQKGSCLLLSPALPAEIESAVITYAGENIKIAVEVDNGGQGNWRVKVNDIAYNVNSLLLSDKLRGKRISLQKR